MLSKPFSNFKATALNSTYRLPFIFPLPPVLTHTRQSSRNNSCNVYLQVKGGAASRLWGMRVNYMFPLLDLSLFGLLVLLSGRSPPSVWKDAAPLGEHVWSLGGRRSTPRKRSR